MRIAVSQLNYKIGDFEGNLQKITQAITEQSDKADIIIFSELALSGYYPKDLINQPQFIEAQNIALEQLRLVTKKYAISVIIGLITANHSSKDKPFHNSLCFITKGEILYTYHKKLLPVYNIFDEARHFAPGVESGVFSFHHQKIGFLICEDGWAQLEAFPYPLDPVEELVNQSLDLIIAINGSPNNIGKQEQRLQHFGSIANRCKAPLIYVNQVGGNDDIVFDGASFVLNEQGKIEKCLPSFQEATGIVSFSNKSPTFSVPFEAYHALDDYELFYKQIILALQDYMKKCSFNKVVLGVSGGIDSAITLALAVKALGAKNVVALAMPSRYSSSHSLTDTQLLCEQFDVLLYTISIDPELSLALQQFENTYQEKPTSLTEQNIQARLRGRFLMEYSNQTGALVLSTGNKSELSVGYTTLYGDMTGGFNLIGDLYKTEVYQLARYFNRVNPDTVIPLSIIAKPPSAELSFNQKDTDTLPDYTILDPILKLYLEGAHLSLAQKLGCEAAIAQVPKDLIQKIHRMVHLAEFKRKQAPPIVRVQPLAFGMGRQFPIAAIAV